MVDKFNENHGGRTATHQEGWEAALTWLDKAVADSYAQGDAPSLALYGRDDIRTLTDELREVRAKLRLLAFAIGQLCELCDPVKKQMRDD